MRLVSKWKNILIKNDKFIFPQSPIRIMYFLNIPSIKKISGLFLTLSLTRLKKKYYLIFLSFKRIYRFVSYGAAKEGWMNYDLS